MIHFFGGRICLYHLINFTQFILNANQKNCVECLLSISECFSFMWNFNDSFLVYDFGHCSHQNFFGFPHSRLRWRVSDDASLYVRPHPLMHEKYFSFGITTVFKSLLLHRLWIVVVESNVFGSASREWPLSRKCSEGEKFYILFVSLIWFLFSVRSQLSIIFFLISKTMVCLTNLSIKEKNRVNK